MYPERFVNFEKGLPAQAVRPFFKGLTGPVSEAGDLEYPEPSKRKLPENDPVIPVLRRPAHPHKAEDKKAKRSGMHIYGLSNGEVALRLLIAALLGGLVGWDRERKEGVAGLRTHMLVCIGSALAMIVSTFGFRDVLHRPGITLDPSRVAAQVISGIGFLGAGTILFLRPQIIRGLTTAAGLWSVAAVGLAVGGGLYSAAVIATIIIFVVLAVIKPIEGSIFRRIRVRTVTILFDSEKTGLAQIEGIVSKHKLTTTEILVHSSSKETSDQLKITFHPKSAPSDILLAIDELKVIDGISEITSRI